VREHRAEHVISGIRMSPAHSTLTASAAGEKAGSAFD
jgi:hypothetical protein